MTTPNIFADSRTLVVNNRFDPGVLRTHGHTILAHADPKQDTAEIQYLVNTNSGLKHLAIGTLNSIVGVRHDGDLIDPTSNIRRNHMITKLRTPSETIARKDLIVALLISDSRAEDEVMHAVALVQDLAEGESITRGYSLKKQDVVGKFVQIVDLSIDGVCTDFVSREMLVARSDQHQLVLDGVIINVPVSAFVIVSEAPKNQNVPSDYNDANV